MCDNDEHNYVADANNWEKRVKGEMEIARKWDEVWGDKYATGQPKDYKGKIKKLEEEMKTLQVARLMTNSQMSYTRVNPYKEYGPNHRRKTFGKQDDEEILKQAEILGIDRKMEDKKESRSKDYYEILGIQKQATDSEIKKAYRKLAIKWHPDKNPGNKEESEQMFQLISEAYEILSNLTLRKLYDDHGLNGLVPGFKPKNEPSQGKNRQYDSYEIFKKFFGDENPFQDMGFNKTPDFNGYKKKSSPKKKKIETVVTSLPCTLEELSRGAEKKIKITRSRYCGNKNIQKDEVKLLSIKILPGWKEGTRITFHGEGDDNVDSLPGDITFIIRELKHENFIRDGNDLIHTIDISLLEALTDCLLKLPTIDQRYVLLACPEVIHPRYERRIEGGGMPNQKTEKRGDLIIRFKINFPQKISQLTKSKLKSILQD